MPVKRFLLLLILLLPLQLSAQLLTDTRLRHYRSHSQQGSELQLYTDADTILVQAYTHGITRVSLSSKNHRPNQQSYSVVLQPQSLTATVTVHDQYLLYDTPETDVYIQKSPLRLKFIQNGDTILSEEVGFYEGDASIGARFQLNEQEALYGAGSRAIAYNRRGKVLKIRNEAHYGYTMGAPVLNIAVPFLVSSKSYGVFFDNHYEGSLDAAAKEEQVVDWHFKGGPATYYVITGKGFAELLKRYTRLTGRQPLPPLWAMGYMQSKYGYKDEQETRSIVKQLQAENIPLDAVVLDLYWFGQEGDMGRLDWDRSKFPDAEGMVKELKKSGVHTILITEPYVTRKSENFQELAAKELLVENEAGDPYVIEDFWTGAAALIDITKPEARAWMWQFYKKQVQSGIGGWWTDLGEPEHHSADMRHEGGLKPYEVHNIFSHLWAKMLYEGYRKDFPAQRLFNLSRSGYAGSQHYAIFPWSGDIARSWEGFQAQIPIMLGMSMSGIGYMHSDLGGFTGGEKDPELYTRWLQMGAFSPIMRAHGAGGIPTEPVFYDEPEKTIVRDFIRLRYRLMLYVYTMAWRNTTEGLPLALPMNFFDPTDQKLQDVNDQYFWGEHMLVAPVLEKGMESRQVVLPSGTWVDFWTGQAYAGIQTIRVPTPLERMPLFVKGGSFIPMTNARTSLSSYRTDTLSLLYYAEGAPASSGFTLYIDNGTTTDTAAYQLLKLSANRSATGLNLMIAQEGPGFAEAPQRRLLRWEAVGTNTAPANVSWNGQSLPLVAAKKLLRPGNAYYDHASRRLHVWVMYDQGTGSLRMDDVTIGRPAAGQIQQGNASPIGTTTASELRLHDPATDTLAGTKIFTFEVPQLGNYTLEVRDARERTVYIRSYYGIAPGRYQEDFNAVDSRNNPLPAGDYTLILSSSKEQRRQPLPLR